MKGGGGEKFATSALDPDFTFRAINATLYGRNNNKERQFERLSLSVRGVDDRPTGRRGRADCQNRSTTPRRSAGAGAARKRES